VVAKSRERNKERKKIGNVLQRNNVERPRNNYCGGKATIRPAFVDVTVSYIKIEFVQQCF